jgi:hypothetical protein
MTKLQLQLLIKEEVLKLSFKTNNPFLQLTDYNYLEPRESELTAFVTVIKQNKFVPRKKNIE